MAGVFEHEHGCLDVTRSTSPLEVLVHMILHILDVLLKTAHSHVAFNLEMGGFLVTLDAIHEIVIAVFFLRCRYC